MDRGAWWAAVHGVAKRWTQLSMHTQGQQKERSGWRCGQSRWKGLPGQGFWAYVLCLELRESMIVEPKLAPPHPGRHAPPSCL